MSRSPSSPSLRALVCTAALFASAGARAAHESAEDARITDATLVADAMGWTLQDTLDLMDDSDAFDDLVTSIRMTWPDDFSDGVFAASPTDSSHLYFKSTVPSGVDALITASGLSVNTHDDVGKNGLEWMQQVSDITDFLEGEQIRDFLVAFDSVDNIDVVIGGGVPAPTLPVGLQGDVTVTEVTGSTMRLESAPVWGGNEALISGVFTCTTGFNVRHKSTGVTGVTTAGHCSDINQVKDSAGNIVSATYQDDHQGRHGDFSWFTTSRAEPATFIYNHAQDDRDVTSVKTTWFRNQWACLYGQSSDSRVCDQIYRTSVSAASKSDPSVTLRHLVVMDDNNGISGDSGGTWSYVSKAIGLHTGEITMGDGNKHDAFSRAARLDNAMDVEVRVAP
ncbi:MAG: hypothetical protein D6798_05635 [Deltaproteobacteria bacterium]|nr:MAG: hypothetical protein D6798_05635 [Deltaproteobacteria bacterium]